MNDDMQVRKNVVDYGPNPTVSWMTPEAFAMALATGNGIFIPSGVYYVRLIRSRWRINKHDRCRPLRQPDRLPSAPTRQRPIIRAGAPGVLADFLVN